MEFLDAIVEERIQFAMRRGELSGLPGEGKPLQLDDDALVPSELRMAMRILKNAGYIPAELQAISEINQLIACVDRQEGPATSGRARQRLNVLLARLEEAGFAATSRSLLAQYEERLLSRFHKVSDPD